MMLKREGTEMVDNRNNRTEMFLDGERIVDREQINGNLQLGKFREDRGNDIASKFQWTSLLKGSEKPVYDGVESGFRDSENGGFGRRYDGLVDRELNRNVASYSRNGGRDNVTGVSVLEPKYVENVRNLSDIRGIDRRDSGNMNGLPVEDAEYHRIKRVDHPVECSDHRRHRSLTGHSVDYGGRFPGREYQWDVNRRCAVKSYEDGKSVRYWSEDNSRSLTPRSQSNDKHTPYRGIPSTNVEGSRSHREGFHHPSDGFGTINGSAPPLSFCDSHRIVCSSADACARPVPNTSITNRRSDYDQTSGRHLRYIHSDSQVSGNVYRRVLSKDNFDTYEKSSYYDGHRDVSENDALNPPLPRLKYNVNYSERHLEDDRLHTSDYTLKEEPMVDINFMSGTAHEMEYDGVDLESMNEYLEYRPDASHETLHYKEDYPSEYDAYGVVSHEDERWNDEMLEDGVLNLDENSQQNMGSQYVDLYNQPKRRPKRKHEFVEKMKWPKHRTSTLGGRGALSYGNRHLPIEPEDELVHPNKRSNHHLHPKVNARMSKTGSRQPFGGLSKELQSRLSKPIESGSNNIKTRLTFPRSVPRFVPRLHGPQASKLMKGNVNHSPTQPYVKVKPKSGKKGHKSSPHIDVHQADPQVSHHNIHLESEKKLTARSSGTTKDKGPSLEGDVDHSIFKVKPTVKDPPENSEELKQQVDYWFLKCMLYLNANPGRHKKFKELGNAGTLKCIICSSAKEFSQTKDVATHAFTSLKVGLRAPHLGFHKALCFLMGWDPEVATNGRWVCKSLPDVEAQTLKEDIILWPPVFVIHSCSVRDFYDNDQVKVSIEQLENILRDMGLSEGKASICYGKSGNPNIMLVKFSGTLSGLQEAQRLHNVFAEKKHGKTELLEIASNGGSSKEVDQEPEDKLENILYGYMGIVEDFDKLSFDMRQRYVAKSKKEILAHVDNNAI